MKKPIALVLGATGGIGQATRAALLDSGYRVIPVGSNMLDFNKEDGETKLVELLDGADADVIINCAGVFINGTQDTHHRTFNVNFGSNWGIIRYYHARREHSKSVKIIMVGSSSYSFGKSMYPLYSASKAALYNLWQASVDLFAGSDIGVDLINPMRTKTAMNAQHQRSDLPYHQPEDVAKEIVKLISAPGSSCINMTLEEPK